MFHTGGESKVAQTSAIEVCGLIGLIRHGAPTQAAQISTPWQWSRVNGYSGMSPAQPMRRCGLTIASLPLDSKARISGRTADLKDGGLRYACWPNFRTRRSEVVYLQ
jgi:hypothetical protein